MLLLHCRIQHELEISTKQAIFVDSSISDTIRTCIVLGNHRAALRVKTEFKVRFYLISLPSFLERKAMLFFVIRFFYVLYVVPRGFASFAL